MTLIPQAGSHIGTPNEPRMVVSKLSKALSKLFNMQQKIEGQPSELLATQHGQEEGGSDAAQVKAGEEGPDGQSRRTPSLWTNDEKGAFLSCFKVSCFCFSWQTPPRFASIVPPKLYGQIWRSGQSQTLLSVSPFL